MASRMFWPAAGQPGAATSCKQPRRRPDVAAAALSCRLALGTRNPSPVRRPRQTRGRAPAVLPRGPRVSAAQHTPGSAAKRGTVAVRPHAWPAASVTVIAPGGGPGLGVGGGGGG